MKNPFNYFISFILIGLVALPVWAITIHGGTGSTIQGGWAKMQGSSVAQLFPASLISRLDSTITASYPGTGDDWLDVGGDSAYDFFLGRDGAINGEEPTFLGSVGDKDAAFVFAADQKSTLKANTDFINRIHKTDETSLGVTFELSFYWPLNPKSGLIYFFGNSDATTIHGFRLQFNNTGDVWRFVQTDGVAPGNETTLSTTPPEKGAINFLILSIQKTSGTDGTFRFTLNNNAVATGALTTFGASTTDASKSFQWSGVGSSAEFASEMKMKGGSIFSQALSSTQEDTVRSLMETAYGNTFPTSTENVRHLMWNSPNDLLLGNVDSLDVTSEKFFDNDQGFMVVRYKAPTTFSSYDYFFLANDGSLNDVIGMRIGSAGKPRTLVQNGGNARNSGEVDDQLIPDTTNTFAITWKPGESNGYSGGAIRHGTYVGDPTGLNIINFAGRNSNLDASDLTLYDIYIGESFKTAAELEQYIYAEGDLKIAAGGQSLARSYIDSAESGGEEGKQNLRTAVHAEIAEKNTVTFINGAVGGSGIVQTTNAVKYWWNNISDSPGPSLIDFKADMAASGFTPNILFWSQGEADSGTIPTFTTREEYKAGLLSTLNNIRATYGDIPVIIQIIGRQTGLANPGGVQAVRDSQFELIDEYAWIHRGPDSYDQPLFDNVHPNDVAMDVLGTRLGNNVLAQQGFTVASAVGPSITNASRSGTSVTVTLAHDSGTDFTPVTGIEGFHFFDDGSEIVINSAVRTNTSTITLTLASPPTGVETLYYIYDDEDPLTLSNVVKDNAATSMPLQSTKLGL